MRFCRLPAVLVCRAAGTEESAENNWKGSCPVRVEKQDGLKRAFPPLRVPARTEQAAE